MAYNRRIICLANSRKPGGRCIAGKEVLKRGYGFWIRPVSDRPTAEVSFNERQYENGKDPQILDIIDIPMLTAVPRAHQTENEMIDANQYWRKTGALTWVNVGDLVDDPPTLWGTGNSTRQGRHDRIPQAAASHLQNLLWLIKPENVTIRVLTPGADYDNPKRAVRASFRYNNTDYDFKVTDPFAEQAYLAQTNGDYGLDQDVYFCISLAEAHKDGYCYKLVATMISDQLL